MRRFWDENISCLKEKDPQLYRQVCQFAPRDIGEVIPTRSLPTLRFDRPGPNYAYLYNQNDPIKTLSDWLPILKNESALDATVCVFIGLGMGYSQRIALEQRQDIYRMVILEPCLDMFCLAMHYADLRPLLASDKVVVMAGEIDWDTFYDTIINTGVQTDYLISDYPPLSEWRPELYAETKSVAGARVSRALSACGALTEYGEQLFENRISNLTLLRTAAPADALKGAFQGLPAVLVSAGPSLGRSMGHLKEAVGRCVMIAADSAVAPLLKNGIVPDFVTTLDFRNMNSEKLSPDLIGEARFSLIAGAVSSSLAAKRLSLKHLFFSFQENETQAWILKALKVKHLMAPVNSVALLSLSAAQMMGADPIIFTGYDFAFTSVERDHVKGAVFSHDWHDQTSKFITVPGINGEGVPTLRPFLEFKQNLEKMLGNHPADYINATAAGAHIKGTQVRDLASVMGHYTDKRIPLDRIMDSCVHGVDRAQVLSFIRAAEKELAAARKASGQVRKIGKICRQSKEFLTKPFTEKLTRFSQLPQKARQIIRKLKKARAELELFMPMEEMAAKKLYEAKNIQAFEKADNEIEVLIKENKILETEMAGHAHGIELFSRLVGNLVSYLSTEDQILSKIQQGRFRETDFLELAALYLKNGDSAKARSLLEQCMAEFPGSARCRLLQGEAFAQMLDFDKSFEVWEGALANQPDLAPKIEEKRAAMAANWMERAKNEPGIWETCLKRALKLRNDDAFFRQLKDANYWWSSSHAIVRLIDQGRIREAALFLSVWRPIENYTPSWRFLKARLMDLEDKKEQALEMAQSALEERPDNAEWAAFTARLLMETDRFDQGVVRLEEAVALDSGQAVLWEELGDTFYGVEDYANAVGAYERCAAALPDRLVVLNKIGDCFILMEQFSTAGRIYRMVLEKEPGNREARKGLGKIPV
ncbi:MAG: DUF115 domain-containing protein [Desulfobacter sp.]|nr:MAG: DUF115 domain-containing protein [Desulfobacter sp.]